MTKDVKSEKMTTTSLILSGAAAKKLVETIVVDLYESAKRHVSLQVKKWKWVNHIDAIYKRIKQLRFVKTILQSEREVDLTNFYHPSRVYIGNQKVVVHQLADFNIDSSIVIEGTVGQGKSIFLRYLATVEFCVSRRIPVFLELRRCRAGLSLTEMALQELKALGLEMSLDMFNFFVGEGRILLLLDAFDEVKEELRQDLITEIENLIRQHEALRVVITSRPESGIATSSFLRVFRLCPLEGREYEEVIKRMAHSPEIAQAIIAGIRKEATQVAQLLTTPLIVALLLVRYRIDQSLPQNSAAFYDSLFALLLQRHDKTKGGYVRPRKSGTTDIFLEEFFNAFCFVTRKADQVSFGRAELKGFAKEALALVGTKSDIDKLLADIVEITCMLITDGEETRFIHKSVQEYHAAVFIKGQPDDLVRNFYQAMKAKWSIWQQDLRFLAQIDRYRYLKYFYIPELRRVLTLGGEICTDKIPPALIDEVCGGDYVTFEKNRRTFYHHVTGRSWPTLQMVYNSAYGGDIFQCVSKADRAAASPAEIMDYKAVTVSEMIKHSEIGEEIKACCISFCESLQRELKNAEAFTARVDGMKDVFRF